MSQSNFEQRQAAAAAYIGKEGLDAILLEDTEGRRCSSIRYLTGLPQDGLLFIFKSGRTVLVPWDIIMAGKTATASRILPLTDFDRNPEKVVKGVLSMENIGAGAKIEISSRTPYPMFRKLESAVTGASLSCPEKGVEHRIEESRACKDPGEIEYIRRAATITNEVLDLLIGKVESGSITTELEAAMFIEQAGRERGSEGTGFETLAAGPSRSFGIHAFPSYTRGPIGGEGFSIIDFGFRYNGYTSDVTVPIVRGNLSGKQEKMATLVQKTHDAAVAAAVPGACIREICTMVDDTFAGEGFSMPHSLGHGIGLDAHEAPMVSTRAEADAVLEPGMIITIEPGLYAEDAGGIRLENDVLITPGGNEVLTRSRIVRLR